MAWDKGHSDVVQLLLEKGATADTADALIWASWIGQSDVVKLLLEKGATVDTANEHGSTAVEHASVKGHSDVVKPAGEGGYSRYSW